MLVLDDAEVGHCESAVADAAQHLELGRRCPRIDDRHFAALQLGDDQVVDRHVGEVEAVAGGIKPNNVGGRRVDEEHTACGAIDWGRSGCRSGCRRHCVNGDPRQGMELRVGEGDSTLEFDTAGEGAGQAGVVINGHLIGHIITAQIDIRGVIRLGGSTH